MNFFMGKGKSITISIEGVRVGTQKKKKTFENGLPQEVEWFLEGSGTSKETTKFTFVYHDISIRVIRYFNKIWLTSFHFLS